MIHSPPGVHSSSKSLDEARAASDASFLQAASDARLNRSLLTRDLFAGGSASFLPHLLQAHNELQFLGGGLSALRTPPARHEYSAFLNGMGGHPHIGDSSYLQQALGGACSNSLLFTSLGPAPGHSAPLTMPSQTFASLSSRMPSLLSNAPRSHPNAQKIHDAISTLQAAAAAPSAAPRTEEFAPPVVSVEAEQTTPPGGIAPMVVYMECDEESLSDYQCLLRKQIELFEATSDDVQWNAQGRNKAIFLGQVGIRCRHCARLPTWSRARGAVYYSATLDGLYQAAQNMAKNHLCRHCRLIPEETRHRLIGLRDCKRRAAGGKKYWAEGAQVSGVRQGSDGLRFKMSTTGKEQN